jgi:hypothetical protein
MLPGSVSLTSTERYPPRERAYRTDGCRPLWKAAGAQFERGMHQNSSGKYADGSLRRRFHVSVRHHPPASDVILRLSPLSRYDRTRLDVDPVVVHWRVGGQNASSP